MDNISYNKDNLRDNTLVALINNFDKPQFKEGLPQNRHIFNKEELLVVDYFINNPDKVDNFRNSNYRDMCVKIIQDEIDRIDTENQAKEDELSWIKLNNKGNGGQVGSNNLQQENLGIEDMVDDLDDFEDIMNLDILQDQLEEMVSGEQSIVTDYIANKIEAKMMTITINGVILDIHFIENTSKSLEIMGKTKHELAFLWTFPEMEPVMNVPAFMRLFENNTMVDCEVATNYKDPDMIEYRLLKGLLALEMGRND